MSGAEASSIFIADDRQSWRSHTFRRADFSEASRDVLRHAIALERRHQRSIVAVCVPGHGLPEHRAPSGLPARPAGS